MKQNATYKWTDAKEQAAQAIAEGVLTEAQIARDAGVNRVQLFRWKQEPAFAERVKALMADFAEASRKRAIGRREDRIEAYQRRWELIQKVREERGADPRMVDIPGGTTGLLVVEESEVVMEDVIVDGVMLKRPVAVPTKVAVDTGTLKAELDLEKQASIESNQWTEKRELTGKDGKPLIPSCKVFAGFNPETDV